MLNDIENGVIVTTQNSYFSRLLCKKFVNEIDNETFYIFDELDNKQSLCQKCNNKKSNNYGETN